MKTKRMPPKTWATRKKYHEFYLVGIRQLTIRYLT